MSAAKASNSASVKLDPCSLTGSPDSCSTSLQELKNQISSQSGNLVLVSEKEHSNGYSVCYQPAASRENICKKYYKEILQRWQQRQKRHDLTFCERKHVEAAARRATLRQKERERLSKQLQLIEKANGKKQEMVESRCARVQQVLEVKVLEAWNRHLEHQKELRQKYNKESKKVARCREELERRATELKNKLEARESKAFALRTEYLQKIKKKCAATSEKTSLASTVTTEA